MPRRLQKLYRDPALSRFSAFHAAFAAQTPSLPFSGDCVLSLPEDFPEPFGGRALLVRNSSEEPGFAPPGESLLPTMIYARRCISLREENRAEYRRKKELLAGAVQAFLTGRMPELRGKLAPIDVWTPATYRRYVASEIGSFMSFSLPAKRAPASLPCRVPGLRNVYLAGQWLRIPGGLPLAAESGREAALAVVKAAKRGL